MGLRISMFGQEKLFLNWDSLLCKTEEPLQGMELQEKEEDKD